MGPETTRFAPSPTGFLHLGHAFAAWHAWTAARRSGGRFLLRIEDIDRTRCRPAFEAAIREDLAWLGLIWDPPVRRQSDHMADYAAALDRLEARGLLYSCFCTRAEIAAEIAASASAPHGPDGPLYPGTCRALDPAARAARTAAGTPYALRLDMTAARAAVTQPLEFEEAAQGRITATPEIFGDVVLARKETPASYHLCVVHDDAQAGVTLVTRGEDLAPATHLHRLLQALLGLPVPRYRHHALLRGADGTRLAKRSGAPALRDLRAAGHNPVEILGRLSGQGAGG